MSLMIVTDVTRFKLSHMPDKNSAIATFHALEDIIGYSVNRDGVSYDTGVLLDRELMNVENLAGSQVAYVGNNLTVKDVRCIAAEVDTTTQITADDLPNEGSHRINVYGQKTDGSWSSWYQG